MPDVTGQGFHIPDELIATAVLTVLGWGGNRVLARLEKLVKEVLLLQNMIGGPDGLRHRVVELEKSVKAVRHRVRNGQQAAQTQLDLHHLELRRILEHCGLRPLGTNEARRVAPDAERTE